MPSIRIPRLVLLMAVTVLAGCEPPRDHNLYRMNSDGSGKVYALWRRGPTFHLPPRWSVTEPQPPGQQFRVVRDKSDGAFSLCFFDVTADDRYRGLTGRQILDSFHDPRLELEEWATLGTLDDIDELQINGLPALRSRWTAVDPASRATVRMTMIAASCDGYVVTSTCTVCESNAAGVASELDDIQLSLRARVSPFDALAGARAARR
jgi:hypothetical protein